MKIDFKLETRSIERKLGKANQKRGRIAMAGQILTDSNQYVPMKVGTLRGSAHISNSGDSIYWNTPYARRRYYEENVKFSTPNTGAKWDMIAKAKHLDSWKRVLCKGMGF